MGHSKTEKGKTHERIVAIASKRFRERGLAGDIARSDKRTRALASEEIRSRAILTYSALVGAIALARAESDEALSLEILNTVAELLKNLAS